MTISHQPRSEDERVGRAAAAQFTTDAAAENASAWEEIDTGRYMPRRIKGSYRGRALG